MVDGQSRQLPTQILAEYKAPPGSAALLAHPALGSDAGRWKILGVPVVHKGWAESAPTPCSDITFRETSQITFVWVGGQQNDTFATVKVQIWYVQCKTLKTGRKYIPLIFFDRFTLVIWKNQIWINVFHVPFKGLAENRGDKKSNVVSSILMKFWSRSNLDQLDLLGRQCTGYGVGINIHSSQSNLELVIYVELSISRTKVTKFRCNLPVR